MNKFKQQTLALASILQTTALVEQLASTGICDKNSNEISLKSIIIQSADVEDIFPSSKDLSIGLRALNTLLDKKTPSIQNVVLYALTLVNLEKKLMKNKPLLAQLTAEIDLIKNQDFFKINHTNSLARLAALYKSTLGELNPRVIVNGKQLYLSNQRIADHIRALLLAGIRAVSLWKSHGGRPWQLLLNKRKILKLVKTMDF